MKTNLAVLLALAAILGARAETNANAKAEAPSATAEIVAPAEVATLAEVAAPAQAEAPAAAEAPVAATNAPAASIKEAGTDEIDLEEIDDSADAAKRPNVTAKEGAETLVDISCDDATLADILRQFRKATGANIISADSTNLSRRVSATLTGVPWQQGLSSILNARGFRLDQREGIYRVVEDLQTVPISTRTFQLNHAAAQELCDLFNKSYAKKDAAGKIPQPIATCFSGANVVVVTAPEKVISDCEAIIKAVDKAIAQIYIEARFMELSNEAMHKLGLQWDALESWSVSAKGLSAGWEVNDGKAADYGTFLSQRNLNNNNSKTANANGGASSSTSANTSDNTTDSANYTGLIPNAIQDAAGAGRSAADMGWRSASGFSGQLSASDFKLALSAFEQFGEGRIFSNPKIIVSNGKEAKVDMTTKEPNVSIDSQYTGLNSQNLSISTKLETIPGEDKLMFAKEAFFSYGIELSVKPRISPDGLITVEIVPTISNHAGDKTVGTAESGTYTTYPIIEVKRLITEFTMKDGCTAVIGGLSKTAEEDVDSGIPYLRKLPWIGPKLFGWKSRQKVQREIIVFVTVGIANPEALPQDVGLPKNAIMGREYIVGDKREPGDRDGNTTDKLAIDMTPVPHDPPTKPAKTVQIRIPARDDSKPGTVMIIPTQKEDAQ